MQPRGLCLLYIKIGKGAHLYRDNRVANKLCDQQVKILQKFGQHYHLQLSVVLISAKSSPSLFFLLLGAPVACGPHVVMYVLHTSEVHFIVS